MVIQPRQLEEGAHKSRDESSTIFFGWGDGPDGGVNRDGGAGGGV